MAAIRKGSDGGSIREDDAKGNPEFNKDGQELEHVDVIQEGVDVRFRVLLVIESPELS